MATETILPNQNSEVYGDENEIYQAGRDIVLQSFNQAVEFEDITDREFERYQLTPSIEHFNKHIQTKRLLVIGGDDEIENSELALHVARHLHFKDQSPIPAKRWIPTIETNLNRLIVGLRQTEEATVFILENVRAYDINFGIGLLKIREAITDLHFVILSTGSRPESWKLSEEQTSFWQLANEKEIYSPEFRTDFLIQKLTENNPHLLKAPTDEKITGNYQLVTGLSIKEIAKQINSRSSLIAFSVLLSQEQAPLTKEKVNQLIGQSNDPNRGLTEWYNIQLTEKEQIVAIGMALFEGFFDDQFFAAFEKVVDQEWGKRESSLYSIDYQDLQKLQRFFDTGNNTYTEIRGRIPEQRRLLLEAGWVNRRRMIQKALPILADLVKGSIDSKGTSPNSELYGSKLKKERLQTVISDTLSDLSLLSTTVVNTTLTQLSIDKDYRIQSIVARALAKWRRFRDPAIDQKLFGILSDWQHTSRFLEDMARIILGPMSGEIRTETGLSYRRATVVLAVSYAMLYDPPGELSQDLYKLLEQFATDRSHLVRDRFARILPTVVLLHFDQIIPQIYKIVIDPDLIIPVSNSLAIAYGLFYQKVLSILDKWENECAEKRSGANDKITHRETLLSTVALTYGLIRDAQDMKVGFTAELAVAHLSQILADEKHPLPRRYALRALVSRIEIDFKNNLGEILDAQEENLRKLINSISDSEQDEIINSLKQTYLVQRAELTNGDGSIEINGVEYQVWLKSDRPLTLIEQILYRWIKNDDYPRAQQVATRAYAAMTKSLDLEEQRLIRTQKQEKPVVIPVIKKAAPRRKIRSIGDLWDAILENISRRVDILYLDTIVPAISTLNLGGTKYRLTLKTLLSEMLTLDSLDHANMNLVLERWRKSSDQDIETISKLLERAIWLVKNRKLIYTITSIAFIVIVLILFR